MESSDQTSDIHAVIEETNIAENGIGAADTYETEQEPEITELEEVDYPFSYSKEDWRLVLCDETNSDETGQGEAHKYSFRLYDENGALLQDFPCALEAEELIFRFDELCDYWMDLAVFPSGAGESHADGLLFEWDYREDRFVEEPIQIPWYEEAGGDYTFLVTKREGDADQGDADQGADNGGDEIRSIYCINEVTREPLELRRFILSRDGEEANTGRLSIYDCLEQAAIYDGAVKWNGMDELINDEYYQDMFRKDIRRPFGNYSGTERFTAQIWRDDEETGEHELTTYESREEFLSDCGFQDEEPFYEYYDCFGNLELELYFDKNKGTGCGICCYNGFDGDLKKTVSSEGFIIDEVSEGKWEDAPFSLLTCDGMDALSFGYSPKEIYGYDDDGRLSSYEVRAVYEFEREVGELGYFEDAILKLDWIYRDDGSLYRKYYQHEPRMFSTTRSDQKFYYDGLGRLVYSYGYITHGALDEYYIYDGESQKPGYRVLIDQGGGWAGMVVYR